MELTATTTVRELLHTHPSAFDVLLRYGMCSDCQHDPPLVPLEHFATKHCAGDLDGLIAELRGVIGEASSA